MPLTKSEYLSYLDAPKHLWASTHGEQSLPLSLFDQHLMAQGYEVEKLAKHFVLGRAGKPENMQWQGTYTHGEYEIRTDALVYDPTENVYDLYEIKSSSSDEDYGKPKNIHLYDTTFQALVLESLMTLRHVYVVTLNKEYVRGEELDLDELFLATEIDAEVEHLRDEVEAGRQEALRISALTESRTVEPCYKPKTCPYPRVCHPDLPEYSIYDIARLTHDKAQSLRDEGILDIHDVPTDFPLSAKQRVQVDVAQSGFPKIDRRGVAHELEKLTAPLYFLDYETYPVAIPMYPGYKPHQHMVFQYSLHVLGKDDTEPEHFEYIHTEGGDPAPALLAHLRDHIGPTGSVLVWNKKFEMGKNEEMAERYPEYRDFLMDLNSRIYDLGDTFAYQIYVHPDFKGSWSIKNVLPVMVPDLSYHDLEIGKGDVAMLAWWEMTRGHISDERREEIKANLLEYCGLDTYAMLAIWRKLVETITS